MRALPRMTVVAPCDAEEMARFMPQTTDIEGPIYIRLAKGGDAVVSRPELGFSVGKSILMRPPGRVLLIATGVMTTRALAAADILAARGLDCGVLHVHTLKPLDEDAIVELAQDMEHVVTIEEHTAIGGLGSAVADLVLDRLPGRVPALLRLAIPDAFPDRYGTQDALLAHYGLQPEPLAQAVESFAGSG